MERKKTSEITQKEFNKLLMAVQIISDFRTVALEDKGFAHCYQALANSEKHSKIFSDAVALVTQYAADRHGEVQIEANLAYNHPGWSDLLTVK